MDCWADGAQTARNERVASVTFTGLHAANGAPRASPKRERGRTSRVQKKLGATVTQVKAEFPDQTVEVWGEDEARIGLQPVLRRIWAKRGQRANGRVEPRYQWLWVYAAVHPATGRVFWLILPRLDGDCVQLFLDEFARAHLSEGKRIVLVWDGAPAHRAKKLRIPAAITLLSFPAYTPELNPSERLWSGVKEAIANQRPEDIEQLTDKVAARCRAISADAEAVKSLTSYHWWAAIAP